MAGRRVLPQLGFVPCSIIAGILFLVIVALAQAIAETHPDAVSDRHHGDEFLSRRAHEGGYRRSGSRHRVGQGGLYLTWFSQLKVAPLEFTCCALQGVC